MGRTFSKEWRKIKSKNQRGYHWVRKRAFIKRKTISRIKLTKRTIYQVRSAFSRSLESS